MTKIRAKKNVIEQAAMIVNAIQPELSVFAEAPVANSTAITQEMREKHPKLFSEIDKTWVEHSPRISPEQKAAEIEAAWALHEGKPASLSSELRHVVVKTVGNSRFNAAGEKIIFASKDEIDECARQLRERNREFRLAKGQEQVKASIPVLADHKYHNLADLKRMLV